MRVSVGDVRLYVDVDGAKLRPVEAWLDEVPTVVLVHTGPGADHTPYKQHVGPPLARVAQVVYADLRGCGRSDLSDAGHWNLETWTDDLRALLVRMGVERPVLLAAGWGCFVALRYSSRWPDEVSRLVLVNPVARFLPHRAVARFDELGGGAAGEAAYAYFERPSDATVAEYLRHSFPVLVGMQHAQVLMMTPTWNLQLANHWTAGEVRTLDLRPELAQLTMPTLVVAGTEDPLYDRASIREVVDALPNARASWYEGARHSVFRDAPECIDEIVRFAAP